VNANSILNLGGQLDANAATLNGSVGRNGVLNFASGGGITTTGATATL